MMVNSKTKLLAIVANTRGAIEASTYETITYIGFPLSISETFQQRNTNKSIGEALNILEDVLLSFGKCHAMPPSPCCERAESRG